MAAATQMIFMALALIAASLQGHAAGKKAQTVVAHNVGSYACDDERTGISGRFTYGKNKIPTTGDLKIKGDVLELECQSARLAEAEPYMLFQRNRLQPSDICYGYYSKGNVIAGMTNDSGKVGLTVFLLDEMQSVRAMAQLRCNGISEDAEHYTNDPEAW